MKPWPIMKRSQNDSPCVMGTLHLVNAGSMNDLNSIRYSKH